MSLAGSVGTHPDPFLVAPPMTRAVAQAEAERCLYCFDAPCAAACPSEIDVPAFIRKIATGNPEGSARTILAANPLGGTCGAVCPVERLCEGACVRVAMDGRPIEIGRLQQHAIGALAASGAPFFTPGPDAAATAAILGAGPAGLACAAELRRSGVAVTVYDGQDRPGGLADHGIVPWRQSHALLATEVAEIERAGARIITGTPVRPEDAASVVAAHDAVVVATGLGRARALGVAGEDLEGVVDALALIRQAIEPQPDGPVVGRRVVVIGGGSTAFDAAAAARRLGADEVAICYRRSAAECPAYPHAIDLARSLDVTIHWLTAPVTIRGADGGRVAAVVLERMTLGDPDTTGRPTPRPVPGSAFEIAADTVVRAVGQEGSPALLAALGVPTGSDGRATADPETGRTPVPRVWAIGDVANGGAEVVNAVQAGKLAARSIVRALGLAPARIQAVSRADATLPGVDLWTDVAGIRSPNPFWLASCPITNTGEMVARAFDAGWGGAVWKTVGDPITNVTSRLGALDLDGRRMAGISNIELISDRPIAVNLAEVADIKRRYPRHAVVVSLMVESKREAWTDIVGRVNDTGADGIELNFGCPHGMSERGMGAAVGQVPDYVQMITEWVMSAARVPVLVKLTPNVADIRPPARAARAGGADGIALINTIRSLIGVNLETWAPIPDVRGRGTHGGYSGPAVKPIALNMVAQVASDPEVRIPVSGIGGVADWRDAVEFMLLGASSVQVGTSVMQLGFRMIDDLVDGMSGYLRSKNLHSPSQLVGRALPALTDWGELDQSFRLLAQLDEATCIHCNRCYAACADGGHQAIHLERNGTSKLTVDGDFCVGCRLCQYVCPVEGCITMVELEGAAAVH